MSLDDSYLVYPHRRYGYDHDYYAWSMLQDRPPLRWPGNRPLALWINVSVQVFPLNQRGVPFKPPNGMTMPYPDLRHYSLRAYGNRVGIYRVLGALDRARLRASLAINTELVESAPQLFAHLCQRDDEFLCHGWNMDHPHYGGQDHDVEAALIERSLLGLRKASGRAVRGWLSPGKVHSRNTPALLREHGVDFLADWVNDELPYRFLASDEAPPLYAMPLSTELEDQFVLCHNLHAERSWVEQVQDAHDALVAEAEASGGGRLLTLNLHPWLLGQPHRIGYLEALLDWLAAAGTCWSATPSEILGCFRTQEVTNGGG